MASRQLEKFVNFFSQFFPPSPSPPVITFIKEPLCNTSQAGKKKKRKKKGFATKLGCEMISDITE